MDFYRAAVGSIFDYWASVRLQNEQVIQAFLDKSPWMPEASKRFVMDSIFEVHKFEAFLSDIQKETIDGALDQLEKLLPVFQMGELKN